MPPDTPTRFVVRRLRWEAHYDGALRRLPGDAPVASFADPDEAGAECRRREAEARERVNPFACGPALHYLTHFDEPRLRDWLQDHGVNPPAPDPKTKRTDWAGWWKKAHKKLSAEKRAAVWEGLHKVRFFAVAAEPDRPVGYAVVEINWEYNDETYDADPEGGRLLTVYRSRERAEAACAERNREARAAWGADGTGDEVDPEELEEQFLGMVPFDMSERVRRREGVLDPRGKTRARGAFFSPASVPFFEVVEVPLEGLG